MRTKLLHTSCSKTVHFEIYAMRASVRSVRAIWHAKRWASISTVSKSRSRVAFGCSATAAAALAAGAVFAHGAADEGLETPLQKVFNYESDTAKVGNCE